MTQEPPGLELNLGPTKFRRPLCLRLKRFIRICESLYVTPRRRAAFHNEIRN
jgi:hypothetical protein